MNMSFTASGCLAESLVDIQCNPDIRELSGPYTKSLISRFGLFCLGNTGSNLGPEKTSLFIWVSFYPGQQ